MCTANSPGQSLLACGFIQFELEPTGSGLSLGLQTLHWHTLLHLRGDRRVISAAIMAASPKNEDDELGHTTSIDTADAADNLTKGSKTKSHSRDKDSKESPSAASAKRRCVSTACIACRRRKSKVCCYKFSSSSIVAPMLTYYCTIDSVMATLPVAPLAHLSTEPSASTIPIQTIVVRVFTKRTLII